VGYLWTPAVSPTGKHHIEIGIQPNHFLNLSIEHKKKYSVADDEFGKC